MKQISYKTLEEQDYKGFLLKEAEEKVLQFGEGVFMRAFIENFIDEMNEKAGFNGKVVLVQPRGGHPEITENFEKQDGLYTLILRGRENGEKVSKSRVISCVSRCLDPKADWDAVLACAENQSLRFIFSNTTEAGIAFDANCKLDDVPPASFPAKLTAFLYKRYTLGLPGFYILPCELNDNNGKLLKDCIKKYVTLWELPEDFTKWLEEENTICQTLVDRIVTGYPKAEAEAIEKELGYTDALLDTGEVFASFVIEAPESIKNELPFAKTDLPVVLTTDHKPYKERKVRILNGAHTSMVLGAYLAGEDIVRSCMANDTIRGFMNKCLAEEIIPTLDLDKKELEDFAAAVQERFDNPYIDHELLAIAMNSTSKWKARVMPSVLAYAERMGKLPKCLTFSFAAYAAFYHRGEALENGALIGKRNGQDYLIRDDEAVLQWFYDHRNDDAQAFIDALVKNENFWGDALAKVDGFAETAGEMLARILELGMAEAMKEML